MSVPATGTCQCTPRVNQPSCRSPYFVNSEACHLFTSVATHKRSSSILQGEDTVAIENQRNTKTRCHQTSSRDCLPLVETDGKAQPKLFLGSHSQGECIRAVACTGRKPNTVVHELHHNKLESLPGLPDGFDLQKCGSRSNFRTHQRSVAARQIATLIQPSLQSCPAARRSGCCDGDRDRALPCSVHRRAVVVAVAGDGKL